MTTALAILIGALYASALYMMLRRSLVKLLVGLILLSHAGNLLVFTAAGPTRGVPPLVREGELALAAATADPLPQALVLTAIVISFSVLAFSISLFLRTYQVAATDDLDQMRSTDS